MTSAPYRTCTASWHELQAFRRCRSATKTRPTGHEDPVTLYRSCRYHGGIVLKLIDCLIAAHVTRMQLTGLHADDAFDNLARHPQLVVDRA